MKNTCFIYFLFSVYLLFSLKAESQFFYKDIITHQGNLQQYQLQKNNRVQTIHVTSFENTNNPSEGFYFQQQFNNSWSQLKTIAGTANSGRNVVINYYNSQGLLYRTTDSSNGMYSVYEYLYDSLSRLVQIQNNAMAIGERNKSVEIHNWIYDAKGTPVKMERIREKSDTMLILFKQDSVGNIIEEQRFTKGIAGEKTYYYYDDQKRLTDIVRFSERAGKLIPDFMFDYNEQGQIIQMTTVQPDGRDKITWTYTYTEPGLKESETCFLAQKKLAGRMAYQYVFKK